MPATTRIDAMLDVYQVKVKLEGAPAPIWRRILIPAIMNLVEVHWVLVDAFGWPGKHVFQFRTQFQKNDRRYSLPECRVEELLGGPDPLPAAKAKLYSVAPEIGSTLIWDYNFDEAWTHRIKVEKIRPMKVGDILPWVVDGKKLVPPVGCGGMLFYRDMVKTIANPEVFSIAEANERMRDMQACYEGELA